MSRAKSRDLESRLARCSLAGLFLWGFQVRACLVVFDVVFCNVCPINLYLLLPISSFSGICFVFIHWFLLLILSGMCTFRILCGQVLMNIWILSQCHKAVLILRWLFSSVSVCRWSIICSWAVGKLQESYNAVRKSSLIRVILTAEISSRITCFRNFWAIINRFSSIVL